MVLKSWTRPSLKNDWVLAVWNIWYLVWFGILWYGMMCWYYLALLPCKILDTSLENWLSYGRLKYLVFGIIWYFMVWYGMVLYGMMCWYYLAVLPCKISDSSLENWLCYGRLKYLVWFGILWYGMAWYCMVWCVDIT